MNNKEKFMAYQITKEDIIKRVYFITNLVQVQTGDTMQGALTSKSDAMGGIFDRFINSLAEDVIFDKLILPQIDTEKTVKIIRDFYLYKAGSNGAGLAPDVFGLQIDDNNIPFVVFDEKWKPVEGMPQIEVKTFKAKDQMISLRNQDYDNQYLVLTDMRLRIDYLVPFLDSSILVDSVATEMDMDDSVFIKNDTSRKLSKIKPIDFSNNIIGEIELLSITTGRDFLNQATKCGANISPRRVKEISLRKMNVRNSTNETLNNYSNASPRIPEIFEFNDNWYTKTNISKVNTVCLDFSATNIDKIEICLFNQSSIVIKATDDGCSFNDYLLEKDRQYVVKFETLDRSGNGGTEYFIQKQCAKHIVSHEDALVQQFVDIIANN